MYILVNLSTLKFLNKRHYSYGLCSFLKTCSMFHDDGSCRDFHYLDTNFSIHLGSKQVNFDQCYFKYIFLKKMFKNFSRNRKLSKKKRKLTNYLWKHVYTRFVSR